MTPVNPARCPGRARRKCSWHRGRGWRRRTPRSTRRVGRSGPQGASRRRRPNRRDRTILRMRRPTSRQVGGGSDRRYRCRAGCYHKQISYTSGFCWKKSLSSVVSTPLLQYFANFSVCNRPLQPRITTYNGFGSTRAPDFAASRSTRESILLSSPINSREVAKNAKRDRWVDLLKITSTVLAKYWASTVIFRKNLLRWGLIFRAIPFPYCTCPSERCGVDDSRRNALDPACYSRDTRVFSHAPRSTYCLRI